MTQGPSFDYTQLVSAYTDSYRITLRLCISAPLFLRCLCQLVPSQSLIPEYLAFFKNSDSIPHHDVGRQDGQIHLLKGVHMQNTNYTQRLTKEDGMQNMQ